MPAPMAIEIADWQKGEDMGTYYCVTTAWYDDGHGTAAITDEKQAESAPESSFHYGKTKDIYIDWYDSYEDAVVAVERVRNA